MLQRYIYFDFYVSTRARGGTVYKMASAAKRSIKIIAFVDEKLHHLLLPKIEALSPYAIVLDAGSDIEKYNPENLKEANVLVLHGLGVPTKRTKPNNSNRNPNQNPDRTITLYCNGRVGTAV